jgi:localization factor PodJL
MGFDEAEMRRKLSDVADWLRDQAERPRPQLRAVTPDFEPAYRSPREGHILDELVQRRLAAQYEREQNDERMRTVMDRLDGPIAARPAPLRAAMAEVVERQRHLETARSHEAPAYTPPRDTIANMEAAFERIAAQFEQRAEAAAVKAVAQQPVAAPAVVVSAAPIPPAPAPVAPAPAPDSGIAVAAMEAAFERIASQFEQRLQSAVQQSLPAQPPMPAPLPAPAPLVERRDAVIDMEAALERLAVQFELRTGQTFQAIDTTLQEMRLLIQQTQNQNPVQAAEAAAAEIVHSRLQLMAKATHERIDTVARDLADLRTDTSDAEKRMRDVMDTVRLTLEHIAGRLPQGGLPQGLQSAAATPAEPSLSARARAAAKRAIEETSEPLDLIARDARGGPERRRFIAAARRSVVPDEPLPELKVKYQAPRIAPPARPVPAATTAPSTTKQRLRSAAGLVSSGIVAPPRGRELKRLVMGGAAAAALLFGIYAGSSSLLSGMFGETETAQLDSEAVSTNAASETAPAADAPPPPIVARAPQLFAPKETVGPNTEAFAPSDFTGSVPDQATLATLGPANANLPLEIGSDKLRNEATAGNAEAQYEVGVRFADGRGVARDLPKAVLWLERAARQGLPPAQYRYARLAEKGEGMAKDVAIARRYYEQAAAAGNVQAMHNLGVLYADGAFGQADLPAALNWFSKSAEYGVKDSQYNLGIFYARGIAVQKDPAQSYLWFSLAAAQGDTDAATKRDQIGGKLDAGKAKSLKAEAEAWKPKAAPIEANMVTPPVNGWDQASGRASTKTKAN